MRPSMLVLLALTAGVPVAISSARGGSPTVATAAEYFPQPTYREAKLNEALQRQVSVRFRDATLGEIAAWFSHNLQSPVLLDQRNLDDAGVESDRRISCAVYGVTAHAALDLILGSLDLDFLDKDGAILITTKERVESELFTRVYPVADLVLVKTARRPAGPRGTNVAPYGTGGDSHGSVARSLNASEMSAARFDYRQRKQRQETKALVMADFDSLIEVITTTVRPQSWDEVGGPGSISEVRNANSIAVLQTRDVHEQLLALLRAIRAAKLED
jgi:general secretion pathway protein D